MTVARAGVSPCTTHDCHTLFISAKYAISVSQMVADNNRLLSVFASASRASIAARISRVWMVTVAPGATCPARYTVLLWITPCDIRGPVLMRLIVMGGLLGLLVPPAYNGYTIESRSLQARNICKSDKGIGRTVWIWEFADGRRSSVHRVRDSGWHAPAHSPRPEFHWSSTDVIALCSNELPRKS